MWLCCSELRSTDGGIVWKWEARGEGRREGRRGERRRGEVRGEGRGGEEGRGEEGLWGSLNTLSVLSHNIFHSRNQTFEHNILSLEMKFVKSVLSCFTLKSRWFLVCLGTFHTYDSGNPTSMAYIEISSDTYTVCEPMWVLSTRGHQRGNQCIDRTQLTITTCLSLVKGTETYWRNHAYKTILNPYLFSTGGKYLISPWVGLH